MKRAIPLIFTMCAALTHAAPIPAEPVKLASFDARVQLARAAESDERFKTYHAAMLRRSGRYMARAMRSCSIVAPEPQQKSVVLVADISAEGRATAVEVKPDNAVGRCLARRFSSVSYPSPPAYPDRPGFPVTMRVSVAR